MELIESWGGVRLFRAPIHKDNRGYLYESYSVAELGLFGIHTRWRQTNVSVSYAGTIRGLHYQTYPFAQAKLVAPVSGSIQDITVDLMESSDNFCKAHSFMLNPGDVLCVPEGYAHGFKALKDSIVCYQLSATYSYEHCGGVRWNDPDITGLEWMKTENPNIISERDRNLPSLEDFLEKEKSL